MVDEKLKEGISVFRTGDKAKAKLIFIEVLKSNPKSETAWMGLSRCVDNEDEERFCLGKVLEVNPQNQTAKKAIDVLEETRKTDLEQLGYKSKESTKTTKPISTELKIGKDPNSQRKNSDTKKTRTGKKTSQYWIIGIIIFLILIIFVYGIWLIKNSTNYQALEIPTAVNVTDTFPTPSANPDTGGLAISDDWWEFHGGGSTGGLGDLVRVTGIVQNNSQQIYDDVYIQATAYNNNNQIVGEGADYLHSPSLKPGQITSYNYYFNVTDRPHSVSINIKYGVFQLNAPLVAAPTKLPSATPKPTSTPYPVGSSVVIANMFDEAWKITVTDIKIEDSLSDPNMGDVEGAKGRFAIIFMDVENKSNSSNSFISELELQIEDASGHLYSENLMASLYAEYIYGSKYCEIRLNPNENTSCVAVFDISKQSRFYILVPKQVININNPELPKLLLNIP